MNAAVDGAINERVQFFDLYSENRQRPEEILYESMLRMDRKSPLYDYRYNSIGAMVGKVTYEESGKHTARFAVLVRESTYISQCLDCSMKLYVKLALS